MSVRNIVAIVVGCVALGTAAAQAGDFGLSIRIGDRDRCNDRYYGRPVYYSERYYGVGYDDCYEPVAVTRYYSRPVVIRDCEPRYYPRAYRTRSVYYYDTPRYYRSRSVRIRCD